MSLDGIQCKKHASRYRQTQGPICTHIDWAAGRQTNRQTDWHIGWPRHTSSDQLTDRRTNVVFGVLYHCGEWIVCEACTNTHKPLPNKQLSKDGTSRKQTKPDTAIHNFPTTACPRVAWRIAPPQALLPAHTHQRPRIGRSHSGHDLAKQEWSNSTPTGWPNWLEYSTQFYTEPHSSRDKFGENLYYISIYKLQYTSKIRQLRRRLCRYFLPRRVPFLPLVCTFSLSAPWDIAEEQVVILDDKNHM